MIISVPRIPKYFIYPILVVIVSVPFLVASLGFGINTHGVQLIAIAGVILFQVYRSRQSFNTCGTCGHERHMHDKKDLLRRGHRTLTTIVCDDFRKGKYERNYDHRYWNGEDTIEKWDTSRDK